MTSGSLPITVIIAAKNEAANLSKCLDSLTPVQRIIVIDSQSTDATPQIVKAHGAELVQFHYQGGHPKKRQWALDTIPTTTPWVLLLDADEVVPPALWEEIGQAINRHGDKGTRRQGGEKHDFSLSPPLPVSLS